jgi:hypothetical protein
METILKKFQFIEKNLSLLFINLKMKTASIQQCIKIIAETVAFSMAVPSFNFLVF